MRIIFKFYLLNPNIFKFIYTYIYIYKKDNINEVPVYIAIKSQ